MSEVDETVKKLMSYQGVTGMLIMNHEGIAVKSTMDPTTTTHIGANVHDFTQKCRKTVKELDSYSELTMIRLRTKQYELIIAPGGEREYIVAVIQKPEADGL